MSIKVGILFGGKSQEHEVSILSALSVMRELDSTKYEAIPIGIDKLGEWHRFELQRVLEQLSGKPMEHRNMSALIESKKPQNAAPNLKKDIDVIFPLLHGPLGEDGTVQGMLRLLDLPFVGCSHMSAAIAMDKEMTKRILLSYGIPTARWITLRSKDQASYQEIVQVLGSPFFIKPTHLGSSIGITRVKCEAEYGKALEEGFAFDTKLIAEEAIYGREIECAVIGNRFPKASLPGELILPQGEYYDYRYKYIEGDKVRFDLPACLPETQIEEIRTLAIKAYQAIEGEGMARVDLFLKPNGELLINEINPIPGFTKYSLFPKLWEISGLSYPALLDELIQLALERHAGLSKLRHAL